MLARRTPITVSEEKRQPQRAQEIQGVERASRQNFFLGDKIAAAAKIAACRQARVPVRAWPLAPSTSILIPFITEQLFTSLWQAAADKLHAQLHGSKFMAADFSVAS